ncbi:MAG TPA: hypothetical protein VGO57_17995 [Verrucomicrobiae bacterium]|jgi:hypothetical protein
MKPIDQTVLGFPHGNCFTACIASLLEVPIETLPIIPSEEEWYDTTQMALVPHGVFYLEVRLDVAASYPMYAMRNRLCVITGKSPRGAFWHSVVGRVDHDSENNKVIFETVHDPHPSRLGIEGWPKAVGFLVKSL